MTEIELIEVISVVNEIIESQFQSWLTVTFAAIVASYTAGGRINTFFRGALAVLYVGACGVFYLRYSDAVQIGTAVLEQLRELDSVYIGGPAAGIMRQAVMLSGTVLGVIAVIWPQIGYTKK